MTAATVVEEDVEEEAEEDEDADKAENRDFACCCAGAGCCWWSLLPCFFPARRCPRSSSGCGATRRLLAELLSSEAVGVTTAGGRPTGDFFGGVAVVRIAPPFFVAGEDEAADEATEVAVASTAAVATEVAAVVGAPSSLLTVAF